MSRFFAALRYAWALLFTTQRWAAPALILVGLIAWVWNTPPLSIDTVRIALLVLFALAAWLGHATGTVEEAGQELVSTSALGSPPRLLLAKWTVAAALSAAFPLVMVVGSYLWSERQVAAGGDPLLSADQAWASGASVLLIAACGAALGVLVASLLPAHPGWGSAILVVVALSQAAPGRVPVARLANALPGIGQPVGTDLLLAIAISLALTAGLLAAAVSLRRPAG